jgi:hypothetical protein
MERSHSLPQEPQISELNTRASQELAEISVDTIKAMIEFMHQGLVRFLEIDRALDGKIADEPLVAGQQAEYYVLEDFLAAPTEDGEPQWCMSLKLQNTREKADFDKRINELRVYLPVPEDVTVLEGEVAMPEKIFIEYANIDGENERFSVGLDGFTVYSALQDGEEVTEHDILEGLDSQKRVDTGLPTLAYLFENLVNMTVVPQRRISVGDENTENS